MLNSSRSCHEVRFDGDLGLGEVEGFAPVVTFQHHFHDCLEEQPDFALELAIGPFRCGFPVPDLALVHAGLVLPEGGDTRAELDGGEDELAATGNHHLRHLVHEHLHHLLDLFVGHALHEGGEEGEEVVIPLAAGKICLGGTECLDRVEDGNLRTFCRAGNRCLRAVPIRHQAVVEEVAQVPVLAERAGAEIFEIMDMHLAGEVVVGKVRRELEQVLFL